MNAASHDLYELKLRYRKHYLPGKIIAAEMQLNLPDFMTRYFINEMAELEFNTELKKSLHGWKTGVV